MVSAYERLPKDKKELILQAMQKFVDRFKEVWVALKHLLAEHSTDWSMTDEGELQFTPVILEACPGCGKLFADPTTLCYQPDPLRQRTDWMIRHCVTKSADIYANGENVDDVWESRS